MPRAIAGMNGVDVRPLAEIAAWLRAECFGRTDRW
jgi:hypothetical protein